MLYEVELKFPLSDSRVIVTQLLELGATAGSTQEQVDRYFNHPVRDFRVTDEAFRIRSAGSSNCVTYKGPVVDRETKMRREIEVRFAEGTESADQIADILVLLGFRSVREVRKSRTEYSLEWKDRKFELALDVVPAVGTFLEIELMADESGREQAKTSILDLAALLELTAPERRSYLELVLASDESEKSS